jgi:zinc/manganese transport system substrate-binding protein
MILIFAVAVLVFASGCGGDSDRDGVHVVATTTIAADIVRNVAGPDADVDTLIPESVSPHDYALSAKDRARLEDADLLVAWGALEEGLHLDELDTEVNELAYGWRDPHIWMDPELVAGAVFQLADDLAEVDPSHARAYQRRAREYARRLGHRLFEELRDILAAVPPERRKLVTSHDSLGHLPSAYGFEFVGAPFGLAPESEPSAEKVASLIDRIREERVVAVFADDTDDPELLEEIARETGVEVVDDLLVEGFGGRVESYEEMLRFDAERIAEALAG